MDTAELQWANAIAQLRFKRMLDHGVYGDPTAPATVAYVAAERRVDDLLRNAQWERAKAELDATIAAETAAELAAGDHYAGMPA